MTTVIDPLGSPTPVFNRSGRAIFSFAASGDTEMGAPSIPYVSGEMIVTILTTGAIPTPDRAVKLPSGVDIGDTIELYSDGAADLYPASGDSIDGVSSGVSVAISGIKTTLLRKMSSNSWRIILNLS
jgi:hypothetical protein